MNRFEKRKAAIEESIRQEIKGYKAIYAEAEKEKRDPTDEERLDIESHLKAIETLEAEKKDVEENIKTLERVEDIGRELGPVINPPDVRVAPGGDRQDRLIKTIGEMFTESEAFKSIQANPPRGAEGWSSPVFEAPPAGMMMKGTLTEGSSAPGSGTGGGLIPVPQVVDGVVNTLFQPLTFADLILSGQATGNTLRYVVEGTATSGAAGVAEGGSKPESTLGLSTKDEPIKKIATLLPISEEMLEDAPQVQSYINGRLSLFVRIEEERQLLRGTASGNEIQGILTSRSVPVYSVSTGGTAMLVAENLFKAMNGMRGSAFVEPDWIVMHPTDYQTLRLGKDTANQYYGGGPFLGPYGGPQGPVGSSGQIQGPTDQVWGKQVYVTAAIGGAGTALVGTRANAQVWRRGGLNIQASNSHSTYFQLNLVAIRAEERLGLAVYRPGAFVEVRF